MESDKIFDLKITYHIEYYDGSTFPNTLSVLTFRVLIESYVNLNKI